MENDLPSIAEQLRKNMIFPTVTTESITEEQEHHLDDFYHNMDLFAHEISKIGFSEKPTYTKIKFYLGKCKKAALNLVPKNIE